MLMTTIANVVSCHGNRVPAFSYRRQALLPEHLSTPHAVGCAGYRVGLLAPGLYYISSVFGQQGAHVLKSKLNLAEAASDCN